MASAKESLIAVVEGLSESQAEQLLRAAQDMLKGGHQDDWARLREELKDHPFIQVPKHPPQPSSFEPIKLLDDGPPLSETLLAERR